MPEEELSIIGSIRWDPWQVLLLSALLRGAWASSRLGVGTHLGVSVRRGLSAGAGVGVSGQASWC